MKLQTRILILVAPVIILSAALSGYSIYLNQKDALSKREDSYLELSMGKLASHFKNAISMLNSYSLTLTKSDIIRDYYLNYSDPYRELQLVDRLQQTISTLKATPDSFVGIAILDDKLRIRYYSDNSKEPFSTFDPQLFQYTRSAYFESKQSSHTGYTQNLQGEGVLVRYDALDANTLAPPLSYNRNQLMFIVVVVSLNEFNQTRKHVEFDNDSAIFFSDIPPDLQNKPLAHTVALMNNFYATLDPAQYILDSKLKKMASNLVVAFSLSSVLSILILLALLYRHVIRPIERLDKQLKQVNRSQRDNIEVLYTDDEVGRLSLSFHEMYDKLAKSYEKTKVLAENDQLTGLPNRRVFQHHVRSALANLTSEQHAYLLYIDLDNFKYVNDKYGHQIGDRVLTRFADHLNKLVERCQAQGSFTGLPSRLSGDEFAIFIVTQHQDRSVAKDLANKLLAPIQNKRSSVIGNFPITASIGIASYPEDGHEITSLISSADTAMYQAKKAGKNQIAYYSKELDRVVQRRTQIERALRTKQFDDEFSLTYQPYFDRTGEEIVGVEALLRWENDKLGSVSPDEFIPIAEQIGLFGSIDRWVIKHAFQNFTEIQAIFSHSIHLSINLSSAELDSTSLAHFIEDCLSVYDVNPRLIDFEITETFAGQSQGFPLLHHLSQLGFSLTIDDFGSGYTSITQLVQYPVQKIKLDRYFLETLMMTSKEKVVKPLIDLCHSQNMLVTAEGIESEEMFTWLAEHQCDHLQGFYFSGPLSLDELQLRASNVIQLKDSNEKSHYRLA
ncbi:putative bifunctional diguanylate cyclase/phosphodiesterase [Vibrio astriarenae]|uniref:putative bifunctional diguanylate cyclase/phosphodiesterase n=1 Tax=Vibrio astriarenae TaxID=1481923 RepID=UPI003735586D